MHESFIRPFTSAANAYIGTEEELLARFRSIISEVTINPGITTNAPKCLLADAAHAAADDSVVSLVRLLNEEHTASFMKRTFDIYQRYVTNLQRPLNSALTLRSWPDGDAFEPDSTSPPMPVMEVAS
jgi:hypothetical protein